MECNNLKTALGYAAQQAANWMHGAPSDCNKHGALYLYLGAGGVVTLWPSPRLDDFDVAICVQWIEAGPQGPGVYMGIVSTTNTIDLGAPLPVLYQSLSSVKTGNCPHCSMPIQRALVEGVSVECPTCGLMLRAHEGNWELIG